MLMLHFHLPKAVLLKPIQSNKAKMIVRKLSLEMADSLANGVIDCVKRNKFKPVAVNVVDLHANVLVQKRMDGCNHVGIPEFSYAKAYTCIVMKLSSREFRDKYTNDNSAAKICQMNSMIDISRGKLAAFPGGVLLKNNDNEIVGAIGVSGASGDEDEYAGLKSVWDSGLPLITQPSEHCCKTI